MAEAVQRETRKASTMQMRSSTGRLFGTWMPADGGRVSPPTSSTTFPEMPGISSGLWLGVGGSAPSGTIDEDLTLLRAENKLLRRQLESHPELHRLGAENRLLREHLASLAQQQALVYNDPPWPKGHRQAHARKMKDAKDVQSGTMARTRSLTRTSKP